MSKRNWLREPAGVGLLVLLSIFFGALIADTVLHKIHRAPQRTYEACEQGDLSHCKTLPSSSSVPGGGDDAESHDEKSKRDEYRSEKDLSAQQQMAWWAFGVMILTGLGVALLYATWRETVNVTTETKRIGEAQTRAYLSCARFRLCVSSRGDFVDIIIDLKNFGHSPAREAQAIFRISFTTLESSDLVRWFEMNFRGIQPEELRSKRVSFSTKTQSAVTDDFGAVVQAHIDLALYWTDVFGKEHHEIRNFSLVGKDIVVSEYVSDAKDTTELLRESVRADLMPYFRERREKHKTTYQNPTARAPHQRPPQEPAF